MRILSTLTVAASLTAAFCLLSGLRLAPPAQGSSLATVGLFMNRDASSSVAESAMTTRIWLPVTVQGPDGTAQATPTSAGALTVGDPAVASGRSYTWVSAIDLGSAQYVDRAYTFTTVSPDLVGLRYLRTANADKASTGDTFLSFTVDRNVTVYVAHDERITTKPAWLAGFTATSDTLSSDGGLFRVYRRDFPAGTITLGGNGGTDNQSMYNVILAASGSSVPLPTSTPIATSTGLPVSPTATQTPAPTPTGASTVIPTPTTTPTGSPVSGGRQFFVSPTGDDTRSGTSEADAWATFGRAWKDLYPGDTLVLLDGVYKQSLRPGVRNGEPGKPITIRAKNDGKAVIDGDLNGDGAGDIITAQFGETWTGESGQNPVGNYFTLEGVVIRNGGRDSNDPTKNDYHVGAVLRVWGHDNFFRRVSAYDANVDANTSVISIIGSNNTVEDCIAAGTGRKMIMIFEGGHNTIRRCFANWTRFDARDFSTAWPWGDNIQVYNSSHNTIENSISWGGIPSWGISIQANNPDAITTDNKVLGSVAIRSGIDSNGNVVYWGSPDPNSSCGQVLTRPQPTQYSTTTDFCWPNQRAGYGVYGNGTIQNNLFQDIFAWGSAGLGFAGHRGGGVAITRATIFNNGLNAPTADGGIGADVNGISGYVINDSRIEGTPYQGGGAQLQYRYENGVLTSTALWPWPMEDRLQAELGFSLTNAVTTLIQTGSLP